MYEIIGTIITTAITASGAIIVCVINNMSQMRKLKVEMEKQVENAREEELADIKLALQCQLRNTILEKGDLFCDSLYYCPVHEKQNVVDIYNAYHRLGGNDIATSIKDNILNLPDTPIDDGE